MQEHFIFTDEPTADFRIDERTKAIGRQNIAAARAQLAALTNLSDDHAHAA